MSAAGLFSLPHVIRHAASFTSTTSHTPEKNEGDVEMREVEEE